MKAWILIIILYANPGPVVIHGYDSALDCESAIAFFKNGRAGEYYKSHACIPGPLAKKE